MRRQLSAPVLPKLFVSSLFLLRDFHLLHLFVSLSRLLNLPITMHPPNWPVVTPASLQNTPLHAVSLSPSSFLSRFSLLALLKPV
ncbi:hypothetical protein AUEXF2481DRAFT_595487 [Aureobasidium subglaciale EXF-2481]|uniref:Uncharacterized protein n=1 Tax=Aureobasidium subglaciale (strain EXF-2481) TaxID=1043005 RepID=A0A074ZFJ0_AURSE|nr:uncharacterized protein AUEXF2481DRAFT_595487 [Aureobasidium subglaciale EXF-2481]KEQ97381.1 hypothetical protein AUEXF2481DRAFT_595487 [Aureobasidium subglaciale EXF-2481]